MTAKDYQDAMIPLLTNKLNDLEVIGEWTAFHRVNYQYSPRVDIAVGPFSITPSANQTAQYNEILRQENTDAFLKKIYDFHVANIGDEWLNEINIPEFDFVTRKNQNARCFLAIEIENTSTKKHIMGSMINAASLGRIGIGIAYNDSVKRTFLRILNYLAFLKRVEKNTYDTTNFLILTKEQFQECISDE
jgi:hypothetical protein